jgi:ubiquinone/menaquinone biosynthesis C-methylase UbiE
VDHNKYTESNRRAWNEVTPMHQVAKQDRFFRAFEKPGYSTLDRLITLKLKEIGLNGKRVAQLCCNDGREVFSLSNLGAASVVGFDISDAAIAEAQKLSKSSGIACEFVRSDIYDIPDSYNNSFDLIYISIGVFGWMPDINRFFGVVSRLMAPGAEVLIYEQHPIAEIFEMENRSDPLRITNHYFNDKPMADDTGMDYWGGKQYRGEISYWFFWTLSDIISGLVDHGIQIRSFKEYAHDISSCWVHIENTGKKLPLSYILHGRRA